MEEDIKKIKQQLESELVRLQANNDLLERNMLSQTIKYLTESLCNLNKIIGI